MIARTMTLLLALVLGLSLTALGASAIPGDAEQAVLSREEDLADLRHEDDGPDGGTGTGGGTGTFNSGTGKSHDGTNSRVTGVSRNRDWSRDDLTRDRTDDGRGKVKRDWTKNHTNDRTRNDTR